jgi:RimJ/RimL family protein N-acetyltransferase
LVWWLLARTGAFARGGFTEICIEQDGRLVHRLIVTPAWFRFPFMSPRDLQIGDVWTAPDARRKQLARTAIGEAHRRFAGEGACFWYVTDAANAASAALAKSCGYQLVATGRRTRPIGTSLFGQYVIDQLV